MKAIVALVTGWTLLVPAAAATAQTAPSTANRVSVSYLPPKDPAHRPIYTLLREMQFLEKLQEFLSPVRLPRTLLVKFEGCDGDPNASYEDAVISVCYEYVDELWRTMPSKTTADGVTPIDAVVGPLFDTCLHEFAHALFDMLRVPVLGREEDAADKVSAYIMLHLSKAEARRLVAGTAYGFKTDADADADAAKGPPTMKSFADVHGTPAQRFYNLLCIAYGSDEDLFGDLVAKGHLPKERAEDCEDEYEQIAYAFETLIAPHIDRELAKKIFAKNWLPDPNMKVTKRPVSAKTK
jgi:hypothetical protein